MNPPAAKVSLRSFAGAKKFAKEVASKAAARVRTLPLMKVAIATPFIVAPAIVWDLLVPDEAVEVSRVFAETAVLREQLQRMPPDEALRAFREVSAVYGGNDSSSLVAWVAVGALALIIGVPLLKKAVGV